MKYILSIAVVLSLVSCGAADRAAASLIGVSESCIDGVAYLQFTSGATVKVTPEGKPVTCK